MVAKSPKREISNFRSQNPFRKCETPLGTRVPFRSTPPSFRNCKMGCEIGYENGPPLRKCPSAAKMPLRCKIDPPLRKLKRPLASIFFNSINSIFLINRSFELQIGAREEPNHSNLPSSPSHLSLSRARLRPSPSVNHGKNPRS